MALIRPTLQALVDRAVADFEAELPGTDARLRRSNLGVLARVHAGAVHGLYGYLEGLAGELMPDTATGVYLERHAALWGLERKVAVAAQGLVWLLGAQGALVPAGTRLVTADGREFLTTELVEMVADGQVGPPGANAYATVVAAQAGAAGDVAAATHLTLVVPLPGVVAVGIVAVGGLSGGAETESDDALRERLLTRLAAPPMGGAAADYVAWALEVPGVTRAWAAPLELGAGTVVLRFTRDGDASPIPDAGEVATVQAHVDDLRPVCAAVTVMAPVPVAVNFNVALTPNSAAVRAAVAAELADLLQREGAPGATLLISHVREAISLAAGEANHVLVAPSADVTFAAGQMAVMGTLTWS